MADSEFFFNVDLYFSGVNSIYNLRMYSVALLNLYAKCLLLGINTRDYIL